MTKQHITQLDLEKFERGKLHKVWFDIITDPFGVPISLPMLIGRGSEEGPVLGLTAAVHGNELNGIPVIQTLFREIQDKKIRGTVIGIPVVNVPSFMRKQRRFVDGVDLNHVMPGVKNGNVSQVYAYRFVQKILTKFNYLIDLHTASFGRVNSYYVRVDLDDKVASELARLQHAQIIVDNPPSDGTLRGEADSMNIPAITLEVGNPNTFQRGMIRSGITGLYNAMVYLNMVDDEIDEPDSEAVICKNSKWMYTDHGGLLTVRPQLASWVKKGEIVATELDIFGDKIRDYVAPDDGIIIGKSTNPVNQTGGRILHLGLQ